MAYIATVGAIKIIIFSLKSFRELSNSNSIKYKLEIKQSFKKDYLIGIAILRDLETIVGFELEKKL